MSTEASAGTPTAPVDVAPTAPAAQAPSAPAAPTAPDMAKTYTAQEMSDANGEAARWRKTLREEQAAKAALEEQLKVINDGKLAEEGRWKELAEAAQQEAVKIRAEYTEKVTRSELKSIALSEGILDADIASLIKIPDGYDGELADLVAAHKAAKPSLYKAAAAAPAPAAPAAPAKPGAPAPIPAAAPGTPTTDVKSMPKKEYEAYKKALLTKMRSRY